MTIAKLILTVIWVCGIIIAKGFWSTFFAIFIPLWSWYLAIEAGLKYFGVL